MRDSDLTFSKYSQPAHACRRCPRLTQYRRTNHIKFPDWHNGAVGPTGAPSAKLLILGLAPGLKGANRTGGVFVGDSSGKFLFEALLRTGLASGHYDPHTPATISAPDIAITNCVACAPPGNAPTREEFAQCAPFVSRQIRQMKALTVILALGHHAHRECLRHFNKTPAQTSFGHHKLHDLSVPHKTIPGHATGRIALIDSYHCSRQNTQTGRLTPAMFDAMLDTVRIRLRA